MPGSLRDYHSFLFEWHCERFHPLRDGLSDAEMRYLGTCFGLATDYSEESRTGYGHFSYYTYSHRVRGSDVNSSRFAYGSLSQPARAWEVAKPVLDERGVSVDPFFTEDDASVFYGLGWDLLAGHFKLYFHVADVRGLPGDLDALVGSAAARDEGLVSFTWAGGDLHERKVYLYPTEDGSGDHRALMSTSARGVVPQDDVSDPAAWRGKLNSAGQRILDAYDDIGETLDTIAYEDRDRFTLYFP